MVTSVTVLDSTGATQTVNTLPALGQAAKAASLPVTLAKDDTGYTSVLSVTRTADTNAYAANDAIGTGVSAGNAVLTFANLAPGAAEMMITTVSLEIDITAVVSGMTSFRLYLYSATPNSNLADNAAWDFTSGDRATFIGYVDLGTPVDLGSTLYVKSYSGDTITTAGTSVFGYLVTNGAWTPASASVFVITLHAVRAQS